MSRLLTLPSSLSIRLFSSSFRFPSLLTNKSLNVSSFSTSTPSLLPVHEITSSTQFETLKESNTILILDFYAPWCGPCKLLTPILTRVCSSSTPSPLHLVKINVDEQMDLAASYSISSLPTVAVLKNGKLVDQFMGVRDENAGKRELVFSTLLSFVCFRVLSVKPTVFDRKKND